MAEPTSVGDVAADALARIAAEAAAGLDAQTRLVLDAVASAYGLNPANPRIFKGEFDRNIRVDDLDHAGTNRGTWLVKVSSAAPDRDDHADPEDAIRWQETVLVATAADETIPFLTPRVLPTRDGRLHIHLDADGREHECPRDCATDEGARAVASRGTTNDSRETSVAGTVSGGLIVRVVSWISGALMNEGTSAGDAEASLLRSLGAASARLTRALSGVTMPAEIPQHEWMLQRGPEIVTDALDRLEAAAGGDVPDASATVGQAGGTDDDLTARIATVRTIVNRFADTVTPVIDDLPWAVVHHDLHDANVVLDADGTRVAGVIDFNDAVYAPRIADLAITAGYAMLRRADPEAAFRTVVAGYREILEPSAAEIDVLGELALMRLCMNWSQWRARALTAADPEYPLARSKDTWPVVAHLAEAGVPHP